MNRTRPARILGCASLALFAQLLSAGVSAEARDATDALMAAAGTAIASSGIQCTAIDARAIRPEQITSANSLSTINSNTDASGFNTGSGATAAFNGGSNLGGANGGNTGCTNTDTAAATTGATGEALCDSAATTSNSLDADGTSTEKSTTYAYEVACSEGLGYVIMNQPSLSTKTHKSTYVSYDCLDMAGAGQKFLQCSLEENQDSSKAMTALISKSGANCDLAGERGVGHIGDTSLFEVSCKNSEGFLLSTARPVKFDQAVVATPCLDIADNAPIACKLTDTASIVAALSNYAATSGNNCKVSAHRWIGNSANGTVFEVACADGGDYVIRQAPTGSFDAMVSCAGSSSCTLTKKAG